MKIKKYRKHNDFSYTLGTTLTIELLKTRPDLVTNVLYHSKMEKNNTYELIESLCSGNSIPFENNDKAFNILSEKENCYTIGQFKKFDCELEEKSHIVLVNPANAGNLGTIIRTAIGFGINNIGIIRPAVDIFDPKVIRSSMGAIFHLYFKYYESFEEYRSEFRKHHFYPFMLQGNLSLADTVFDEPFSLIFGNEASGLPNEYQNYGQTVLIKHQNMIDSLNLPIAVSIALYEATKYKF